MRNSTGSEYNVVSIKLILSFYRAIKVLLLNSAEYVDKVNDVIYIILKTIIFINTKSCRGMAKVSLHYRTQYNCRKSITDVNFQYALQARFVSSMINAFHFYEQRRGLDPCKYLKMETTRALITANNCTSLISNRFINSLRTANSSNC